MLSMKSGQRSIQQGMVCVRKERRRGWGEEGCRDACGWSDSVLGTAAEGAQGPVQEPGHSPRDDRTPVGAPGGVMTRLFSSTSLEG